MKSLAVGIYLMISLLLPALVHAQTVRLAIGEWPPFTSSTDPNGKLAEQLVTEAFALVGYEVEYDYFPWKRSYAFALSGEYDGTFPWYPSDERQETFLMTNEPLIEEQEVFFHRSDLDFEWQEFGDLKPYRIGGTIGYSHVNLLREAGIEVRTAATDRLNLRMLQAGRIDLFPISYLVGNNLIHKLFSPEEAASITSHPKPLTNGKMYMLMSRHTEDGTTLSRQFDEGLRQLKASGRYDQLMDQYMNPLQ